MVEFPQLYRRDGIRIELSKEVRMNEGYNLVWWMMMMMMVMMERFALTREKSDFAVSHIRVPPTNISAVTPGRFDDVTIAGTPLSLARVLPTYAEAQQAAANNIGAFGGGL